MDTGLTLTELAETWDRLIAGVRAYGRAPSEANPVALKYRVREAAALAAAGNPYTRIAALDAEIARLSQRKDTPDDAESRADGSPDPVARRRPGRPRKARAA